MRLIEAICRSKYLQGLSRRWRKKAGKRRLGNPIASSSSDLIRMNPRQYWASTDPQYNGSAKGFPIRCGLKRTALSVIRRFNIIFLPRFIVRNVQLDEQKMEISCHHFGQRNVSIFLIDSSFWMDKKEGGNIWFHLFILEEWMNIPFKWIRSEYFFCDKTDLQSASVVTHKPIERRTMGDAINYNNALQNVSAASLFSRFLGPKIHIHKFP